MKRNKAVILIGVCIIAVTLSGCATIKEWGRGIMGVSTKILDDNRKIALKKSFALDYNSCYADVKTVLNEKDKESPIYFEDLQAKMIAVYFSQTDCTPVGIFFTEQENGETLLEISSPSVYAKEDFADRIFAVLTKRIKNEVKKNEVQAEAKAAIKEEAPKGVEKEVSN